MVDANEDQQEVERRTQLARLVQSQTPLVHKDRLSIGLWKTLHNNPKPCWQRGSALGSSTRHKTLKRSEDSLNNFDKRFSSTRFVSTCHDRVELMSSG